jgi:hypothetical protein
MGPLTRALHVDYVEGLQAFSRWYLKCRGEVRTRYLFGYLFRYLPT